MKAMTASRTCACGRRAARGESKCVRCAAVRELGPSYSGGYASARRRVVQEERFCWLCGEMWLMSGETWTADHLLPKSQGGGDERSNLRLAHSTCNQWRGDREVTDKVLSEIARRRRQMMEIEA